MDLSLAVLETAGPKKFEPGVLFLALQVMLVEFYKGAPDLVKFQEAWSPEHTYLDKLKVKCGPVGSTRSHPRISGEVAGPRWLGESTC